MSSKRSTEQVTFRISEDKKSLIEYAARLTGKSKTDFYTDSALRAAEEAVLDHTLFQMDDDAFQSFSAALDQPVANDKLQKLLSTKAPWE